jgi:hypothetical protein
MAELTWFRAHLLLRGKSDDTVLSSRGSWTRPTDLVKCHAQQSYLLPADKPHRPRMPQLRQRGFLGAGAVRHSAR